MADGLYTRFLAWLNRIPLGWKVLGIFLASGLLWVLILWGVSLIASAGECRNAQVTAGELPPRQYRHEPKLPFQYQPREFIQAMAKGDAVGFYGKKTKVIFICAGLTGDALRIIRMHEEAHAMGWRH